MPVHPEWRREEETEIKTRKAIAKLSITRSLDQF